MPRFSAAAFLQRNSLACTLHIEHFAGAQMKFAKLSFYIAFVWGILILTPLLFLFNTISRQDPPPITHPGFYYGFVSTALAFQFVFLLIARDPIRNRIMMIPSILEKFGYATCFIVLYLQHRLHPQDLALAGIDILLGLLFVIAFLKTASSTH